MTIGIKAAIFLLVTTGIAWLSRSSLHDRQHHGFYRFFAWETILLLFLLNMDFWFLDPFSPVHLLSWTFLIISLVLIYLGVRMFHRLGNLDQERADPGLVGIEKTTTLVTTGVYRYIRHPFYSSLLFLGWGIMLKKAGWLTFLLAGITTLFLQMTAQKEEAENIEFFGEEYRAYMAKTKRFIPFIF